MTAAVATTLETSFNLLCEEQTFVLCSYQLLQHAGDLGNITAGPDGRATFRLTDKVIKVWDVIGRSVVVTDGADDLGCGNHPQSLKDGNSGQRLVACIYFGIEE